MSTFELFQALVHSNVERKVTLTDSMTTMRELLESDRSICKSDYSRKNLEAHTRCTAADQFREVEKRSVADDAQFGRVSYPLTGRPM